MGIDSVDIATDVQHLAAGNLISLYELDATDIGASQVYYFTENTDAGSSVVFNSITYLPLDFEVEDLEVSGSGQLPEPTIRFSNVNNAIGAAVNSLQDLVGAVLTRRRTFEKYLDGRPAADPTAQFPIDLFVIEQKLSHNKIFIEFKLVPWLDYTGVRMPKRQVLRDSCSYLYRTWDVDAGDFDYTGVTECPYTLETGDPGFPGYTDINGDACSAADDDCGKRLSDCTHRNEANPDLKDSKNRFTIPFGGFPNVAKIRVR